MIDLRVTTSARVCREADNGKTVHHVSFHPFEPVLACAVAAGRISLLEQARNYSGEPSPFCFWKETVSETGAKYPVKCLEWNVSHSSTRTKQSCSTFTAFRLTGRDSPPDTRTGPSSFGTKPGASCCRGANTRAPFGVSAGIRPPSTFSPRPATMG